MIVTANETENQRNQMGEFLSRFQGAEVVKF